MREILTLFILITVAAKKIETYARKWCNDRGDSYNSRAHIITKVQTRGMLLNESLIMNLIETLYFAGKFTSPYHWVFLDNYEQYLSQRKCAIKCSRL